MRGYTQLTQEERYQIYALKKVGHSQAEIAALDTALAGNVAGPSRGLSMAPSGCVDSATRIGWVGQRSQGEPWPARLGMKIFSIPGLARPVIPLGSMSGGRGTAQWKRP